MLEVTIATHKTEANQGQINKDDYTTAMQRIHFPSIVSEGHQRVSERVKTSPEYQETTVTLSTMPGAKVCGWTRKNLLREMITP